MYIPRGQKHFDSMYDFNGYDVDFSIVCGDTRRFNKPSLPIYSIGH
jgi:hypothetical protein